MLVNINSKSLRYGSFLGFHLSRLEFLWDSPYDPEGTYFIPAKKKVLSLLPHDKLIIDDSSYQSFCESILNYYFYNDIDIYSAILIGFSIQRCVVSVASDDRNKEQWKELASSCLNSIPKTIVPNKNKLFSLIEENKDLDFFQILDMLEEATLSNVKPTLFLSYCSTDECIADIIEKALNSETDSRITISRYTRLPYKQSFKQFMESIPEHDFMLCIVSDSYLKSQACMYEIGEIIKDHQYKRKLLFVVLNENDQKYYPDTNKRSAAAKVYGSELNRLAYVRFWKEKYEQLESEIRLINDPEATNRSSLALHEIGKIYRNDISEFLSFLSTYNGKSFEELYSNKFADLIDWIFRN